MAWIDLNTPPAPPRPNTEEEERELNYLIAKAAPRRIVLLTDDKDMFSVMEVILADGLQPPDVVSTLNKLSALYAPDRLLAVEHLRGNEWKRYHWKWGEKIRK